jgi:predicted DNA-binding transcriptional regulator AlpA
MNRNQFTATSQSPETSKATSASSTFDNLPDSGYIRQWQLIPAVVPFSSATLWRKCKAGHFPKPVKLSERVTAWRVGDVRQFLLNQARAA